MEFWGDFIILAAACMCLTENADPRMQAWERLSDERVSKFIVAGVAARYNTSPRKLLRGWEANRRNFILELLPYS